MVNQFISNLSHQDIGKQFNIRKTITGAIILLIGISLLIDAGLLIQESFSLHNVVLLISSILLCLAGFYQLQYKSKEVRYLPTRSVIKEKSYSFNLRYLETLKEMIETGNFADNNFIEKETNGNLRMDVMMSDDKKFAAVRLVQFIPYSYIPITDIQYMRNDNINALESFLDPQK